MRLTAAATATAALALVLGLVGGCEAERDRPGPAVTWVDDLAPALAACTECHGGAAPAGAYDLSTYLGALGAGSDAIANAIAADATSALLVRIDPVAADAVHAGFDELHELVRRWIVEDELAYARSSIHPPGVLDPASPGFHGRELEARGWDLGLCASCHGDDFAGGAAGVSCTSCHVRGPDACDTCHAEQPTTGAHANHTGAAVACASCHKVPARWDDEGHVRRAGLADPPPAEVELTGLAAVTLDPADRAGPPVFAGGTCANVYCHGAVLGPAGGVATTPVWAATPAPAACDRCHGAPPPSHATADCATCHPSGARHLDGAVDLGHGLPGCSGCHGSAASPAPPSDLSGATVTTALGVGAHQAHLQGPHRLAAPIPCAACHAVPATVTAPGHVDSAQPAEVDASLGWDRATGTCATAWCHGPARPVWTTMGQVSCGSCHAIPPASHTPGLPLTSCASCHPATVDPFGNILFAGGITAHLDGDVDAP